MGFTNTILQSLQKIAKISCLLFFKTVDYIDANKHKIFEGVA